MATEQLNCPHCTVKFPKFFTSNSGERRSGLKALTDHIRMFHPQAVEAEESKDETLAQLDDRANNPKWYLP
jgi:hypothetical protein